MAKYKEISMEVEALQYDGTNTADLHELCGNYFCEPVDGTPYVKVAGQNVELFASDYVVKIDEDDFCVYSSDYFDRAYTSATEIEWKENPEIEKMFKYHAPKEGQPEIYEAIRSKVKGVAYYIDEITPKSREKSLAMTKLEEAVMWANAAVARNE